MQRLKKILLFVAGSIIVPFLLGASVTPIFGLENFKYLHGFFGMVYLLSYFLFPVLYKKDMPEHFPNRYTFYGVLYLGVSMLIAIICLLFDFFE